MKPQVSTPPVSRKAAVEPRVYLPRLTIRWLADEPDTRVQAIEATAVFVDVSGFTAMSERLARTGKLGAEEVADVIGDVFARLLTTAYDNGGSLLKFGGDALLLLFRGDEHQVRGVRAAAGMRAALRSLGPIPTSVGKVRLRVSAGVHSDTFQCFLVGDTHRELIIAGPAMTTTVAMEAFAESGETVVSPTTAAFLPAGLLGEPRGDGFLLKGGASLPEASGLRLPDRELHEGQLLAGIPVALREHVLSSDADSEHRRATVAFIGYHGVDDLLAREGAEVVCDHLEWLVSSVQAACEAHGVTFLGTDVDRDGGKIILVAGAPTAAGEDEQRLLLAACEVRDAAAALPIQIGVSSGALFAGGVGPPYRRTLHRHGRHREPGSPGDGPRRARPGTRRRRGAGGSRHRVCIEPGRAVHGQGQAGAGRCRGGARAAGQQAHDLSRPPPGGSRARAGHSARRACDAQNGARRDDRGDRSGRHR